MAAVDAVDAGVAGVAGVAAAAHAGVFDAPASVRSLWNSCVSCGARSCTSTTPVAFAVASKNCPATACGHATVRIIFC